MPKATYHFPNGFLWGTATSAHQVEGNNTNNNWAYWENQPGRIYQNQKAGSACDWWGGRWQDDFDRAAETGQNAHRLSVEWSRVQPAPDRWNDDALDVYRDMLRGLRSRSMTAMVTLHHFTEPIWLMEQGGWEHPDTPALFEAFVRRTVDALREYCTIWVPINEPNVFTYCAYMDGSFPPGKRDQAAAFLVMANMVRGHSLAYRAIKSMQRESRVGTAIHVRRMVPARSWLPLDRFLANQFSQNFNDSFLDVLRTGRLNFLFRTQEIREAIGTQDFVGLNYYTKENVGFHPLHPKEFFASRSYRKDAERSETGYLAHEPVGLFEVLKQAHKLRLPIFITENGIEDSHDSLRPAYITEHIHQLWRAINFNWYVKGYFHWTLVDNFEWERGWSQRFGLWGLDPETQVRTRRPSADLYAAICKENALSADTVQRYAPAALARLYPE